MSAPVLARGRSLRVVDRRRVSTLLSTRLFNPLVKAATNAGLAVPGIAILETTGRKSGQPWRRPVGRSLDGDTCWIVAEHGHNASHVRNIEGDPSVRIKIGLAVGSGASWREARFARVDRTAGNGFMHAGDAGARPQRGAERAGKR